MSGLQGCAAGKRDVSPFLLPCQHPPGASGESWINPRRIRNTFAFIFCLLLSFFVLLGHLSRVQPVVLEFVQRHHPFPSLSMAALVQLGCKGTHTPGTGCIPVSTDPLQRGSGPQYLKPPLQGLAARTGDLFLWFLCAFVKLNMPGAE